MAIISDIRKSVTESTPALAVIGATDLAVEKVRAVPVKARVQDVQKALEPQALQQVPALAVSRVLDVAGQVETRYEGLAERGKVLVERVRTQKATQDLMAQGRATLSRTRAAVTTARRAVDDTTSAARSTVSVGRKEIRETAGAVGKQVEQSVAATEKVVAQRTSGTRSAAKRTVTTARQTAGQTRSTAKGAATSARRTAEKAEKAAGAGAGKVGH